MIQLVDSSEFQKDKVKYAKFLIHKYVNMDLLKLSIKVLIWLLFGRVAIHFGLAGLYVILSGFAIIFRNLGEREKGTMSAYSIFNKGCKSLMGTLTEQDFGYGLRKQTEVEEEKTQDHSEFDNLSADQMMAKLTKLGNKPCFCDSGRKYKKCHYYLHQREKQEEQDEIRRNSRVQRKNE